MNIPAPIAAMTSGIAAVFVPLRSVRLFVLAILAVCAAGVMAMPSDQTKFWIQEGVSRLDHNDVQNAEICFLIAYNHAQKSRKGERYEEYCSHRLAEIYESAGRLEEAEKMLKQHTAVHSKSGCVNCKLQVEDRRDLARVLVKEGKIWQANAVIDPVEAAVICSYQIDDSGHERLISEGLTYVPALPSACRFHKDCEHDVELEARGLLANLEASGCRAHKDYPETEGAWVNMGRAGADGSRVVPGLNDKFVDVVEFYDSRYPMPLKQETFLTIPKQAKKAH